MEVDAPKVQCCRDLFAIRRVWAIGTTLPRKDPQRIHRHLSGAQHRTDPSTAEFARLVALPRAPDLSTLKCGSIPFEHITSRSHPPSSAARSSRTPPHRRRISQFSTRGFSRTLFCPLPSTSHHQQPIALTSCPFVLVPGGKTLHPRTNLHKTIIPQLPRS